MFPRVKRPVSKAETSDRGDPTVVFRAMINKGEHSDRKGRIREDEKKVGREKGWEINISNKTLLNARHLGFR